MKDNVLKGASILTAMLMFSMLLNNATWAEAAWSATRQLSWVNTVVGDPLMTFAIMGDMNGDGILNSLDVEGFKLALASTDIFEAQYGFDPISRGDFNGDGRLNSLDVTEFKMSLGADSDPSTVPEPLTIILIGTALMGVFRKRR